MYRPPNSKANWWEELQTVYNDIVESRIYNNIVLIGDLNAHIPSSDGNRLIKFIDCNNLSYHIDVPTRLTEHKSSILDQLITNNKNIVYKTMVEDPVSSNDHCTIGTWF